MSNKPSLGGINAILRKQREEASQTNAGKENTGASLPIRELGKEVASPANNSQTRSHLPRTNDESRAPSETQLSSEPGKDNLRITHDESLTLNLLDSSHTFSDQPSVANPPPSVTSPSPIATSKPHQPASENHSTIISVSSDKAGSAFSFGERILRLGLTGNELKLYDYIYQHTVLIDQPSCQVKIKDLQIHLGLTQMSVFRILNRLESKHAIARKKIEVNRLLTGIELSLIL